MREAKFPSDYILRISATIQPASKPPHPIEIRALQVSIKSDLQARNGPIVGQVLHRGEMLFCRDRHLYAELMKRWMFDQADWMPIRRRILETRRSKWLDPS